MTAIARRVFPLICLLALILVSSGSEAEITGKKELGIGIISTKPEKRLKDYAPLSRYLARHLRSAGIHDVKVVVAKDTGEMHRLIREGNVDIILESALSTIELEEAGMVPSLLAWRKGVRQYRTLFVVRKNSSIKKLRDLGGETIAFEDAHSTSAFAIPLVELKKSGLKPVPSGDSQKSEQTVVYSFAGEAKNEAFWVTEGKTDAAAFSNNDWDSLPKKLRAELRIIHETSPILRYIVSLRRDMPPSMKNAVESILLHMDSTPEGLRTLEEVSEIRKIERFTDADVQSLEYVRSLIRLLD